MSINSRAYLAATSRQAADESFRPIASMMNRIGRERGWGPMSRAQFDQLRGPRGAFAVGSPQEVVEKILRQHEIFGHQRFLAQLSIGPMPHDKVMRAIELLGAEVAPAIRKALGREAP